MSRATVRAGIAAWLGATPGINTVYRANPKVIPGTAYFAGSVGAPAGAVALVRLGSGHEERVSLAGLSSTGKRVDYPVTIELMMLYIAPARLGGDSGLDATDAFDDLLNAVLTRIRADRTANGTVWEWGEAFIDGLPGDPIHLDSGGVQIWGAITTQATEWL